MALTVVVLQPEEDPTRAREEARITLDAAVVRVGRGEGADVRLPDLSVSPAHLRIEARGDGSYALVDEGSENGTFVGGERLSEGAEHLVTEHVLVRVGRIWVELHPGARAAPAPPGSTLRLALHLVEKAFGRTGAKPHTQPCIVVSTGQSRKTQWLLSHAKLGATYVIGRGNEAHIQLDEPNASRRHVQFVVRSESEIWVRDLGSSNGTLLGQERLEPGIDVPWPPGVELRVGASSLVYRHPWREALLELERQATETLDTISETDSPSSGTRSPVNAPDADEANATAGDEKTAARSGGPISPDVARSPDAPIVMAPEPAETSRMPARRSSRVVDASIALLALTVLAFCGLAAWVLLASP